MLSNNLSKSMKNEMHMQSKDVKKEECHVFQVKDVKVSIQEIDATPYYDSTWSVVIEASEGIVECNIVRYDDETVEGLEAAIKKLDEITESSIKTLDKKGSIFFD